MGRGRERLRRLAPHLGILGTLLGLALAEVAQHGLPIPDPFPAVFLLGTLAGVAYAALTGGFRPGALGAVLVAAYTLHYVSPHEVILDPVPRTFQSGVIMLAIGLTMAFPMAFMKRREDRLRREIIDRNRDLEARNRELTDANAALEAFGYVVSHDLKEPVRAIENYLEAADEEYGTQQGRAFLLTARDSNRKLGKMLQGLLDYSRASSTVPLLRELKVDDVVDSELCRSQYEPMLRERGGELVVHEVPPVQGDETILAQLLGNVILNGFRHNPRPRPRVEVRAAPAADGFVHVVVADNGPGFPPDVLDRFGRLRSGRPSTVKGGFGLVISHRAAQRLGARIWIENADGGEVHLELRAPTRAQRAPSAGLSLPPAAG